jgi:hypothetical protein
MFDDNKCGGISFRGRGAFLVFVHTFGDPLENNWNALIE